MGILRERLAQAAAEYQSPTKHTSLHLWVDAYSIEDIWNHLPIGWNRNKFCLRCNTRSMIHMIMKKDWKQPAEEDLHLKTETVLVLQGGAQNVILDGNTKARLKEIEPEYNVLVKGIGRSIKEVVRIGLRETLH